MNTINLSTIAKQPVRVQFNGYEAMLYPTEKYGYTVHFPAALMAATSDDLPNYIAFLEYVQFFLRNLNDL